MNRRQRSTSLVAEINITPLTDVILVLLVIFMIATPLLAQTGMSVELPTASTAQPIGGTTSVTVTITKGGGVYLEGRALSEAALKDRMAALKAQIAKVSVLLKVDQGAPFKHVVNVLDVLEELGIKDFGIAATVEK